ncbi:MAG: hypothetical protein ACHQ2Z_02485 [Elusimicrobiota bacterium]
MIIRALLLVGLTALSGASRAAPAAPRVREIPGNRILSVFVSQDFINELLAKNVKSKMFHEVTVELDTKSGDIVLRGIVDVPVEELRAINLEPGMGTFRFQVAVQPKSTKKGHLVLVFPLDRTFFYPADSKDPEHDRVIVPVQLLSVALASARGYLAALSGDFTGFDRRTRRLQGQIEELDREIKEAKSADALEGLKNDREGLVLQLAAIPIERRQMQELAKTFEKMVGFAGEKEISLNDELASRRNALILRIPLSQLAPYLTGVDLGGVRLVHDAKDGAGENFLAIDVDAHLAVRVPPPIVSTGAARKGDKTAPSVILRLNQALFESAEVVAAEGRDMDSRIRNFALEFKEDGLHASGEWRTLGLIHIPFDAIIGFVWISPDVFEIRVSELEIAGIDLKVLTKIALETVRKRLDAAMKGICTFEYVGEEKDRSRAMRVTVNVPALLPAFPDLRLTGIVSRDKELLLKAGRL